MSENNKIFTGVFKDFIRKRSISQNLTIVLVLLVFLVVTSILTIIYANQSQDLRIKLESDADEFVVSISNTLSLPLWHFDYENAKQVGAVYAKNKLFKRIRILESSGNIIFDFSDDKNHFGDIIVRKQDVIHDGNVLGSVEINIGLDSVDNELSRLLKIAMVILIGSIIVILGATKYFLGIFLSSPIQKLQQGMERVAAGHYSHKLDELFDPQLDQIAAQYEQMALKVEERIFAQNKLNIKLQEEIAERRRTEEELLKSQLALDESEKNFRGIVERIFDGILVMDLDGRIIYISPSVERITGYRSEEVIGRQYLDFLVESDKQRSKRNFNALITGTDSLSSRLRFVKNGGIIIHIDANSSPVKKDDELIGIQTIFRDVSDKVKAEIELQKLNKELEARVDERTKQLKMAIDELESFSYSVSHDLRTPLRHLNSFAKMLRNRSFEILDDESKRYLDIIADSSTRMDRLILDLLNFSRIGKIPLSKQKVDMNQLLTEVQDELKDDISLKRIVLEIERLPFVEGDFNLLKLVIQNLLSNAIKFTSVRDEAHIKIGALKETGTGNIKATFYVKDNGCGFEQEYANKIFSVFQRLHGKDEFEGTGIGLAIVQRIIQRHGGEVWAVGGIDEGATFYFTLDPSVE